MKPRQRRMKLGEPDGGRKWTVEDVPGREYLALCERDKAGVIAISDIGVGSSAGLWNVRYREARRPRPAWPGWVRKNTLDAG